MALYCGACGGESHALDCGGLDEELASLVDVKRFLIIFLLFSFLLMPVGFLFAGENVVLHQRNWVEIYNSGKKEQNPKELTFREIHEMIRSMNYGRWIGKSAEIKGYFDRESLTSFRVTEDPYPPAPMCQSCIDKDLLMSPKVYAPAEAVKSIEPGLVRVRGNLVLYPERLSLKNKNKPFIEIEAEEIAVPQKS